MQWKDDRVSALLLGRRAVRVIPFPGSVSEEGAEPLLVGVRILLESEIDEARLDAAQYVKNEAGKRKLDAAELLSIDAELLDREVQRAIVFRAYVDADTVSAKEVARFFQSIQAVRQLDSVIFRALFDVYLDHHNYVNPLRELSEPEVRELADALSKGQTERAFLALYDAASLRRLVLSLAALRATSPTGSSDTSSS